MQYIVYVWQLRNIDCQHKSNTFDLKIVCLKWEYTLEFILSLFIYLPGDIWTCFAQLQQRRPSWFW